MTRFLFAALLIPVAMLAASSLALLGAAYLVFAVGWEGWRRVSGSLEPQVKEGDRV